MTSCYFVCNQGGWCETRGSFATRAGAATQFSFPEARCCDGIYLTVGVKQHCVLWAGFECCVTMLPSHSVSSKDVEESLGEASADKV